MIRKSGKTVKSASRVIKLLGDGVDLGKKRETPLHHDLDQLIGVWSREEAEFDRAFEDQRKIEPELWK